MSTNDRLNDPDHMPSNEPHSLADWMCGARRRGTDQLCRAPAMSNGRCRVHGGSSPRGPAHPSFKHGRHSRSFLANLPTDLRDRINQALHDPELLSMRREAAVLSARVTQTLEQWAQHDTAQYREDLKASWNRFELANALPATTDEERQAKITAVGTALNEHKQLIEAGGEEAAAWSQVDQAIKSKISACQAEHRRLFDMKQMLTTEQALELIIAISEILQHRIQDRVLLSLIGSDIERRFGLVGPSALPSDKVVEAVDVIDSVDAIETETINAENGGDA